MKLTVDLVNTNYDIDVDRGSLKYAGKLLSLDRRVFIVTDSGVPRIYAETVAAQCRQPYIVVLDQGEGSKSLDIFGSLLSKMLAYGFTRNDCVVAVGGGVVGDLAGFIAATYMRGIDFYNIPTTLLSQVDSSVGGKTAINLDGVKNVVGAFYQPKRVLIDPDVLATLQPRQLSNGMAEALKMSLTSDKKLFDIFENGDPFSLLDEIIIRALQIKRDVVCLDEKENGLRRILNFGHTIGHGIESVRKTEHLFHGECVALGMIPMVSDALRPKLICILQRLSLPTALSFDKDQVLAIIAHDKKSAGDRIMITRVDEPGKYINDQISLEDLREKMSLIQQKEKEACI